MQWAYLRDKPPTGPIIGKPGKIARPVPWAKKIVKTRNVTHRAEGDKHGLYTTVLAAAVFCE